MHFIPAHPIAGTEYSGPDAGFLTLFEGRWTILTPVPDTDAAEVEKLLAAHKPTIPSTIGEEKKANPFLRADVPEVAKSVGLAGSPAWKVFAEIRERKNRS